MPTSPIQSITLAACAATGKSSGRPEDGGANRGRHAGLASDQRAKTKPRTGHRTDAGGCRS